MIDNITLSANYLTQGAIIWNIFGYRMLAERFVHMYNYKWNTDRSDDWDRVLTQEDILLHSSSLSKSTLEALIDIGPGLIAYVTIGKATNSVSLTLALQEGAPEDSVVKALVWLRALYPLADPPTIDEVRMRFWTSTKGGADNISRNIDISPWDTIELNYPQNTRTALTSIMNDFQPAHGGQLILWHGAPGTGKTFALRALAQAWKGWCTVECVIDPEAFFGDASYMMEVLLDSETYQEEDADPDPWRLLILEDAGELLAEDARQRTGQGLSRLLNLADGLIGQGLRTLILVTTNEPLKKLHPAVARPGRCASEIEFKKFTQEEANVWLTDRKVDASAKGSQTLAQLYSQTEGFEVAQGAELQKLGFKAG